MPGVANLFFLMLYCYCYIILINFVNKHKWFLQFTALCYSSYLLFLWTLSWAFNASVKHMKMQTFILTHIHSWSFRHLWDYSTQRVLRYLKSSPHPSIQLLTTLICLKLHLFTSSFLLFSLYSPLFQSLDNVIVGEITPSTQGLTGVLLFRWTLSCLHACMCRWLSLPELYSAHSHITVRDNWPGSVIFIYKQPNQVLNIHKYYIVH